MKKNNSERFTLWVQHYPDHKYEDTTIQKYIRALENIDRHFQVHLSNPILEISDTFEFDRQEKIITSLSNYAQINHKYGHGETSAALRLYKLFLSDT